LIAKNERSLSAFFHARCVSIPAPCSLPHGPQRRRTDPATPGGPISCRPADCRARIGRGLRVHLLRRRGRGEALRARSAPPAHDGRCCRLCATSREISPCGAGRRCGPLIEKAFSAVDADDMQEIADAVQAATGKPGGLPRSRVARAGYRRTVRPNKRNARVSPSPTSRYATRTSSSLSGPGRCPRRPRRAGTRGAWLQPEQLVGGPDWIDSARYDITATVSGDLPLTPSVSSGSTVSPRIGWNGGEGGRMRNDRTSVTLDRFDKGFPCMITSHAVP
jgi:hypothetical protein